MRFVAPVIIGGCWSSTVMVKVPVVVLLDPSVAVTVTVFVPMGNEVPEGGVLVTVTLGPVSLAVTVYSTTALLAPGGATTVMLGGRFRTGPSLSTTVTVKLLVAWLPAPSVPMTTTIVV